MRVSPFFIVNDIVASVIWRDWWNNNKRLTKK